MPSTFAWLDHSEEQRRRVLDIIDLFKEKGTVDELGLGTLRDAIADILFPGTSNIMTRAAYFLSVPWIYQRLERQKIPSAEVAAKAKREELRLIERLLESGEKVGVIGRLARGRLQRLPSSVYWSGLKRLRICSFDGSQDSYHRSLDRFYQRHRMAIRTDDGERVGGGTENWNPKLPAPPDDWPNKAQLALATGQAEFLRDQIRLAAPSSLFAFLVGQKEAPDADFPWAHPFRSQFEDKIIRELDHAQNFSEILNGAPLLYNLMLADITGNPDLQEEYRTRLTEWAEMLRSRMAHLRTWNRRDAWSCVESEGSDIPTATVDFVNRWCEIVMAVGPDRVADHEQARLLIKNREKRLKGALARMDNKRAQELWRGDSGTGHLQFRWSDASGLTQDIVTGIHGRGDA
jgi:hypothetical protein